MAKEKKLKIKEYACCLPGYAVLQILDMEPMLVSNRDMLRIQKAVAECDSAFKSTEIIYTLNARDKYDGAVVRKWTGGEEGTLVYGRGATSSYSDGALDSYLKTFGPGPDTSSYHTARVLCPSEEKYLLKGLKLDEGNCKLKLLEPGEEMMSITYNWLPYVPGDNCQKEPGAFMDGLRWCRKVAKQKMTVAEIEEKLGHGVEVVRG